MTNATLQTGHASTRHTILLPEANPDAPYSAATRFGDLVFTSGQLPIDQQGNTPTDFMQQVNVALDNLERVLTAAGASLSTVLKINAYLADIQDLPTFNEAYTRLITDEGAPARTTVQVASFRGATRVEIDAVALATAPTQGANHD